MAIRDPVEPNVQVRPLNASLPASAPTENEARLHAILGHVFTRPALLREAITHRSAVPGQQLARGRTARQTGAGSNERLEFIGDRVLGLLMAECLAERFPTEQEGQLGPRLALLVSQPVLAAIAEELGLPDLLSVAPGESRAGVRQRATVLADAMEALIGALYLDSGLGPPRRFVRHAWEASVANLTAPPKDPKTALQEWVLARGMALPNYELLSRSGPPHDPVFMVGVAVAGQSGSGTAGSKRAAERLAAAQLLEKLGT